MPSTREIANYVGVSTSTVSLALNNKDGVSKAMRQRILAAANELAVQESTEHAKAVAPNGGRSETVSLLVLHSMFITATDYFKDLLTGIQDAADRYQIQLRLSADNPGHLAEHVTNIYLSDPDLYPDGVISLGTRQLEPTLKKAAEAGLPVVQIGVPYFPEEASFVSPDEIEAGYKAAKHLLELGHETIAVLGHQKDTPHVDQRIEGYYRALAEHHISCRDDLIFLTEYEGEGYQFEVESLTKVTRDFIQQEPDVTAVLFSNWQSSAVGLPLLQETGYRIPEDLSVMVFDDFEHARTFNPPLTAIAYPLVQMGSHAVKLIVEQINNPYLARTHQTFHSRLMVRESVRSHNAAK
ncbi:MAG: LacI family transcriptional regulator [Anaerolineae bacterium]|nr:LacI family transcriptional regulator [Anaerolineae bacterium]